MIDGPRSRLLTAVARLLHRWSEDVLQRGHRIAPPVVELTQAQVPTPDGASANATGPPEHWLELVRQRAPQLLAPNYPRSVASAPRRRIPHPGHRPPLRSASSRSISSRGPDIGPTPTSVRLALPRTTSPRPAASEDHTSHGPSRPVPPHPEVGVPTAEVQPRNAETPAGAGRALSTFPPARPARAKPAPTTASRIPPTPQSDAAVQSSHRRSRLHATLASRPLPEPSAKEARIGDRLPRDPISSGHVRQPEPPPTGDGRGQAEALRPAMGTSHATGFGTRPTLTKPIPLFHEHRSRSRPDTAPAPDVVANDTVQQAAHPRPAEINDRTRPRPESSHADEMFVPVPPLNRWPSLPDLPAAPEDTFAIKLRAWDHQRRLDREQQGD